MLPQHCCVAESITIYDMSPIWAKKKKKCLKGAVKRIWSRWSKYLGVIFFFLAVFGKACPSAVNPTPYQMWASLEKPHTQHLHSAHSDASIESQRHSAKPCNLSALSTKKLRKRANRTGTDSLILHSVLPKTPPFPPGFRA